MLRNYARSRKFKYCSQIGGSESIRDIQEAKNIDADAFEFKIVESLFSISKIIQALKKTYYTTFYFGATTPSFDLETDIDQVYGIEHINNDHILQTINMFKGELVQQPPIYSAIKQKGNKLYDLARKGVKITDIKKRKINVFEFCILKNNFPEIDFKITCSKGTYIRTIANDFGKNLKTGAFVKHLERFSIGDYNINKSISINEFKCSN